MMTRKFACARVYSVGRIASLVALASLVTVVSGCGSKICDNEDHTCAEKLAISYSIEVDHLGKGDCQWPVAKLNLEIEGKGKKNKKLSEYESDFIPGYGSYASYAQIRWYYKDGQNPNLAGDRMRTGERDSVGRGYEYLFSIPQLRRLSPLGELLSKPAPFDVGSFQALRQYAQVGEDYYEFSGSADMGKLFAGLTCSPQPADPDAAQANSELIKQLADACPAGLNLPHCRGLDTARLLALKTQCDDETKAGKTEKPGCTAYAQAFKWKSSYTKEEFQSEFIDRISHYKVTLEVRDEWHWFVDALKNDVASVQTIVICLDGQMKEIACPPEKAATINKANLKYEAAPAVTCDGLAYQRFNMTPSCTKDQDCTTALGLAGSKCVTGKCSTACEKNEDCTGSTKVPSSAACDSNTKTCYAEVVQIFTPRLRSASKLDFVQDDGKPWEASVSAYKDGTIPGVFIHSPSHFGSKGPTSLDLNTTVDIPLPTRTTWPEFIDKLLSTKEPPFLRVGWFQGDAVAGCAIDQFTFVGMVTNVSKELGGSIDGKQIHYRFPANFAGVATAQQGMDWCYVVSKEENGKLVPPDYALRPKAAQKGGTCTACYEKGKACGASSDCCSGTVCDKDKKTCQ